MCDGRSRGPYVMTSTRRPKVIMRLHDSPSVTRPGKQACEVCQTFEPDETGRCPLCAPESNKRSGNVVHDLVAHRDGAA